MKEDKGQPFTRAATGGIGNQGRDKAQATRTPAANQGLYYGFLAAGLFWAVIHLDLGFGHQLQVFFLACVLIAGVYGGLTAERSILYVQALPVLIALIVTLVF